MTGFRRPRSLATIHAPNLQKTLQWSVMLYTFKHQPPGQFTASNPADHFAADMQVRKTATKIGALKQSPEFAFGVTRKETRKNTL
jgi:hypothetical protein